MNGAEATAERKEMGGRTRKKRRRKKKEMKKKRCQTFAP